MTILYCVFFKYFNNLNNLIFNIFLKRKEFFERKTFCSLFKKDSHYDSESTESQKRNEQANNPIHSFNESKNKEQTNLVFSNEKENDLSNQ
jgi:hypothetical protein